MTRKSEFSIPGIYTITNKITGTVYVGQAINVCSRWTGHRRTLRRNKHFRHKHLNRAWQKYGEENFIFEIVVVFPPMSREELDLALDTAEIAVLREYRDNCYNSMEAGISSLVASEETLRLLSEHNKKQWQKPEHRAKISVAQKSAWAEPGRKEERTAQYKEAFKNPGYKERRKQLSKEMWAEGGCLRETQSAKRKANWQDPEYIAKQKASRAKTWKDPKVRELRSRKIKEGWARRKALKLLEL